MARNPVRKLLNVRCEQLEMEVMYILSIISTLLLSFSKAESCFFPQVTYSIFRLSSINTEAVSLESMSDSLFSRSLASH